jgi:hypothetical protein
MALSTTEQLDFLWKKVGFGVTKTDTAANKLAFNEAIPSPLLLRADKLWAQASEIPNARPDTTSTIVRIYKDGTGSWTPTAKLIEDTAASDNRTWKTNLTDWIPPEFGSTYLVSVYIDNDNATTPQTTGTRIFAAGASGTSNDEWFFDYQSGVLHFIGTNLPTAITTGVTGKSIFISGARYVGKFGISSADTLTANTVVITTSANIGNLRIADTTISSTTANSDITLNPDGTGNISLSANTTVTGNTTVIGNLVATNANLGNATYANYFIGDGSLLTNISTSAIAGNLSVDNVTANSITISTIFSGNLNTVNVVTGANTEIDSFAIASARTAKYVVKASNDDGYESLEILLIHNGTDSFITIYGSISTATDSNSIVSLSSNISSGNIKLYASGSNANTVVNFVGTYITD